MRKLDQDLLKSIADGNIKKARSLFVKGANPDCIADAHYLTARKNRTPLMVAALQDNSRDLIDLLTEFNADINMDTKMFGTAIEFAITHYKTDAAIYLIEKGAHPSRRAVALSIHKGTKKVLDALLDNGGELNYQRSKGDQYPPPFEHALMNNNFEYLEKLIDRIEDVNAILFKEGATILHWLAGKIIDDELARLIRKAIDLGANASTKDASGRFPLENVKHANAENDPGYFDMLEMLASPLDKIPEGVFEDTLENNIDGYNFLKSLSEQKAMNLCIGEMEKQGCLAF